jgi:hypothetical protein
VDLAKYLTQTDAKAIFSIIYAWKDEKLTWVFAKHLNPLLAKNRLGNLSMQISYKTGL